MCVRVRSRIKRRGEKRRPNNDTHRQKPRSSVRVKHAEERTRKRQAQGEREREWLSMCVQLTKRGETYTCRTCVRSSFFFRSFFALQTLRRASGSSSRSPPIWTTKEITQNFEEKKRNEPKINTWDVKRDKRPREREKRNSVSCAFL